MMGRRAFGGICGRGLLGVLAGAAAVMLAGCGSNSSGGSFLWQQPYYAKLKVEIDTPQGVKSGYSVIEIKRDRAGKSYRARGEAVSVDLPNRQTVFVLLRSAANPDWLGDLHNNLKLDGPIETNEDLNRKIVANREVWPVKRRDVSVIYDMDNYPYFVRFRDIANPKSVEALDPDNLGKTYGRGYALKSLTVQMTDEAVTTGIAKRLGWLEKMEKFSFEKDGPFDALYPPIVQYLRFK
jgi:hypothetical protein